MPTTTDLDRWRTRLQSALQDATEERWAAEDLDEAIRKAIEEYSLVDPLETITSLTLTAAGREVDISDLPDRIRVTRAWWPYTSTDPEYPPQWCTFEAWGDILFLDTGSEPAIDDVVRVWYTAIHTLQGLEDGDTTSLPPDAETIVLTGAAAFAVSARAAALPEALNVDADVVKRLQAYAGRKLADFERMLGRKARQIAAKSSGIAQAPRLDRWDQRADEEW
jgi:hypothetical protein